EEASGRSETSASSVEQACCRRKRSSTRSYLPRLRAAPARSRRFASRNRRLSGRAHFRGPRLVSVPRARVGAVRLDAQKLFLDEALEDRRARAPFDAAESLYLVNRQVEARHLEIFRPNPFTSVFHRSHAPIVSRAMDWGNCQFCMAMPRTDC